MIPRFSVTLTIAVLAITASGCAVDRQVEHYPNMRDLSDGLTQANHAHGYLRLDCFSCHTAANIHQDDRSLGYGLAASAREQVDENGLASCVDCHTDTSGLLNGVPQ
ncbi:MAG: hypothetical protein A2X94_02695 [Bdellovibrionales bacterium GWB1_55_8]|nr:MAG: hypothetical protein A2X94_02695 [Bdellovibrionales bacterium GWB1_55_8]